MHTSPSVGGSLSPGSSKVSRTALHHSLVLLAAVVLFAVIGLGAAHNWPKVLRVVRPTIQPAVVLVSVAAGAFLISTVHWAGARRYDAILTKVL